MNKIIIRNIIFSAIDQFILLISSLLSGLIIIRCIPRDQYGILGVVAGYYVFFNIINISIEAILLRDHNSYVNDLRKKMFDLIAFNFFKVFIILILSIFLFLFLNFIEDNINFLYAIGIIFTVLAYNAITSPITTLFSAKNNFKLVAKINGFKNFIKLIFLFSLILEGSLKVYLIIEILISFLFILIWFKKVNINFFKFSFFSIDLSFLKKTLYSYSLWTHLNGVVTYFLYKSDTFFLSFFENNYIIGNYNIALNSSNIANTIPSILGYQNSVALSNINDKIEITNITNFFLTISLFFGFVVLISFVLLGKLYINLLTGDSEVDAIFYCQIMIVVGLIISKYIASPLVALINIFGDVKDYFNNVSIILFVTVFFTYGLSAYYFGIYGIAFSNILNAIFWLFLIIKYIKKSELIHFINVDLVGTFNEIHKKYVLYKKSFFR